MTVTSKEIGQPKEGNSEDLQQAVRRQVDRLVLLEFHRNLNLSEGEYRDSLSLPDGVKQPEAYKGRLETPLVIDPRVSLVDQHLLSKPRIEDGGTLDDLRKMFKEMENSTRVPSYPYLAWVRVERMSPLSFPKSFDHYIHVKDECWSPQLEVTSLCLHYLEIFREYGRIDASGSFIELPVETGSEWDNVWFIPGISGGMPNEPPRFDLRRQSDRDVWGHCPMLRGRKIVRLGPREATSGI